MNCTNANSVTSDRDHAITFEAGSWGLVGYKYPIHPFEHRFLSFSTSLSFSPTSLSYFPTSLSSFLHRCLPDHLHQMTPSHPDLPHRLPSRISLLWAASSQLSHMPESFNFHFDVVSSTIYSPTCLAAPLGLFDGPEEHCLESNIYLE